MIEKTFFPFKAASISLPVLANWHIFLYHALYLLVVNLEAISLFAKVIVE